MTGRRSIVSLCALCALIMGAVAVQGAAAHGTTKGLTAFTCKEGAGTSFTDAHCKVPGSGKFGHVAIAQDETTETITTNITTGTERSRALLESKQAGIAQQISAEVVEGSGWMENKLETREFTNGEGKTEIEHEHYVHGEGKVTYKNVTVTKPAGKGCKVKGGQIETNQLTITSTKAGDFVTLKPASGSVLTEFELEGCSTAALNGIYKTEGTIKSSGIGATATSSHGEITEQGTLTSRGQVAGLSGSLTTSGRVKGSGSGYTALSNTTVETANTTP